MYIYLSMYIHIYLSMYICIYVICVFPHWEGHIGTTCQNGKATMNKRRQSQSLFSWLGVALPIQCRVLQQILIHITISDYNHPLMRKLPWVVGTSITRARDLNRSSFSDIYGSDKKIWFEPNRWWVILGGRRKVGNCALQDRQAKSSGNTERRLCWCPVVHWQHEESVQLLWVWVCFGYVKG